MAPKVKLTYFDIAGAGERVRLSFVLAKVPFEDDRVKFPDWGALKPTTPYGQLPLMSIDGGKTMTQSDAMVRYAGSLCPAITEPANVVNEMIGLVTDFQRAWNPCLYIGMNPGQFGYPDEFKGTEEHKALVKGMREKFISSGTMARFVGYFEKQITEMGGNFLAGEHPTIADAYLIPELRKFQAGHIDHVPTDCLDGFEVITAYIARFLALPEVASWYKK
jgi:glutathione S-transferase